MRWRYRILAGSTTLVVIGIGACALIVSHDAPCGTTPAGAPTTAMQAQVYRCYGSPDVIRLERIPKPAAADGRIVVRVKAASVNPIDWHFMRGEPYIVRMMESGIGAPSDIKLGIDFAGTVESIGDHVTRFKPGDDVFGSGDGAFAEYISVRAEGAVIDKPANLSYEQAAAVPIAAVTALQALRDRGNVKPHQRVLINGASGGVGTFAVQIAKAYGADVTAVCSTRNLELVRALGADHAIDYTREDFARGGARYDLIIDNVGNHSLADYRRVLDPHGTLVSVGSLDTGRWLLDTLARSLLVMAWSPFTSQHFKTLFARQDQENLRTLNQLLRSGTVVPVIDRRYPLSAVPDAMRYVEAGHARGKVVIDVE